MWCQRIGRIAMKDPGDFYSHPLPELAYISKHTVMGFNINV